MSNKTLNSPIERFTRKLFSKVIERLAVVVCEKNLSFSQVAALHTIDREGSVNINDISARLNLSMSATSRMIDELVKKDLIDRKEDQENRRAKILTLSSSGRKFMDTLSLERVKIIELSANSIVGKVPKTFLKIFGKKLFKDDKKKETRGPLKFSIKVQKWAGWVPMSRSGLDVIKVIPLIYSFIKLVWDG